MSRRDKTKRLLNRTDWRGRHTVLARHVSTLCEERQLATEQAAKAREEADMAKAELLLLKASMDLEDANDVFNYPEIEKVLKEVVAGAFDKGADHGECFRTPDPGNASGRAFYASQKDIAIATITEKAIVALRDVWLHKQNTGRSK